MEEMEQDIQFNRFSDFGETMSLPNADQKRAVCFLEISEEMLKSQDLAEKTTLVFPYFERYLH